jgi:large subunit ribosomal protein L10
MARPEKVQAVSDIKDRIADARAVFIAEYSGLSVTEQQEMRRALKAASAEFKVFKMTLTRLAASELGHEGLLDLLIGPTGLAFAEGDAATAAKALRDFSKDHEALVIKGGLLAGEMLAPERISELADLEPRDVILAKIAGAFQAPMAKMASLLAAMPRGFASMVSQLIEKAPPEEAPEPEAAEEPVEEAAAPAEEEAASGEPAADDEAAAEEDSADEAEASDDKASDDEAKVEETTDEEPAPEAEEE